MKLTKLEQELMTAIPQDNFYTEGFNSILWTNIMLDELEMGSKKGRGVLTNLGKKGLIHTDGKKDEMMTTLLDEGKAWLVANGVTDPEGNYIKPAPEAPTTVEVKAFTGMVIGTFEITGSTATTLEVTTKKGKLVFDRKTGIQTNAKNPKFANRIK